jgi:hypothetical protein
MEPRTLTCDGRMIATVELADTFGYDRDWYDHVFLFKNDNGYELLVIGRQERYNVDGALARAAARIDVTALPSARALEEVVETRWPASSSAWWRLLARAQEYDPDLYQLWVPERMKHDLELLTVHDRDLATKTAYFGGHALEAPGRQNEYWHEEAVASVSARLNEQGWEVGPGPELSEEFESGGIPSAGTEVVGSLWAARYGHEVPLVVWVDDCGEIYARLADVGDVVGERGPNRPDVDELRTGGPVMARDALSALAQQIPAVGSRGGLEL